MKQTIISIAILLFSAHLVAQTDTNGIVVHKDPRIDQLVKKQIEVNQINTRDARRFVPGFRILIISTNDRNKAMTAKARVYQEFPDLKAYLIYQSPFFKLRIGNFKEHKDAEDVLPEVQRIFPTSVIVRDTIEINPDEKTEKSESQ